MCWLPWWVYIWNTFYKQFLQYLLAYKLQAMDGWKEHLVLLFTMKALLGLLQYAAKAENWDHLQLV